MSKILNYPIAWLQFIAIAVTVITSALTDIEPVLTAAVTALAAAFEGTRRVTPVAPEERGLTSGS